MLINNWMKMRSKSLLQGRVDFVSGKVFAHDEIDWDNLDKMDLG